MDHQRLVRTSKRLAKALRHDPTRLGIQLDAAGWVPVSDVLVAMSLTRTELDAVVAGNDKQRFAIAVGPDGVERIRANQGHSVEVDLGLQPADPPPVLFHGTSATAVDSIMETGLSRQSRHHVHLSIDEATALRVGSRRAGPVVILAVDAAAMAKDGHVFYRSDNGVWLTDAVPTPYLTPLP